MDKVKKKDNREYRVEFLRESDEDGIRKLYAELSGTDWSINVTKLESTGKIMFVASRCDTVYEKIVTDAKPKKA